MPVISSTQRKPILVSLVVFILVIVFFLSPYQSTSIAPSSVPPKNVVPHEFVMPPDEEQFKEPAWKNTTRAKAAFVILTRNSELDDLRKTIQQLEARFNSKFNYPYVFLNDEPFTDEFKELTSGLTKAETKYGLIPQEHWGYPEWIDVEKADKLRHKMGKDGILYGDNLSYRHMCRFESGFFFRHPLMLEYEFYWRVEPSVEFFCDLDYDPFLYMKENNKKYGWTISLLEYESTIPTLWETTKKFMKEYPQYIPENNLIDLISNNGGGSYNLCHFWSNFEIGDLKFLRSPEYTAYFEYLDRAGGFFYERWGDAPVHSIAVGMFLNQSEVHFFNDIGYKHAPFMHCPISRELQKKCHCDAGENFDFTESSCMRKWISVTE
ncbi:glycosyltransferase family 15 protein [Phycomyces blakesleeanus]|uniref:Glycosyltransferase family 15 protein n=2 Tax=Phycomyces blakesleeanus TaxID=4837 RepID=A0A167RCU3_PHYB8|nr:glycosyltransferase family 15 protein [Phycomyces blakesleeanus NRRL 1555(-)]OAD81359.1 glycosyltransferase family 15 protein [Phycomyces blakesleeanus NRRL 1555(-)]|eukprot:XP_018299399.1 glycosyltransferase family 15 protein [Phycomyces blakesleeanus NRRL 1555(-)]